MAGVTTEEIREALLRLKEDRGLLSLSAALGVALQEWFLSHRARVVHPVGGSAKDTLLGGAEGVLHPQDEEGGR